MVQKNPLGKKQIAEIELKLRENKIKSYKMILFGSWVKGRAKEYSDIDLAIISPSFGKDYFNENLLLRKITSEVDEKIEPVAVSSKDINDKYSFLFSEIRKTGQRII